MPSVHKPPAFLFYVDDFSSDGIVEAMTTEEVGAYILLLCKAWREEPPGSIPDDDRVLARWTRLTPSRWSECRTGVLAAFTLGTDSRWHQKRMRLEFNKLKTSAKRRSDAGQRAAEARWSKGNTIEDMPNACDSHTKRNANGIQKPIYGNENEIGNLISLKEIPGKFLFPSSWSERCATQWLKWQSARKAQHHRFMSDVSWEAEAMKFNHLTEDQWFKVLLTSTSVGSKNLCVKDLRDDKNAPSKAPERVQLK